MMTEAVPFWRDRPVLVTGCTGFLGSWLVAALVEAGAKVVGLVRDRTGESRLFADGTAQRITMVWGQVEDAALLERVVNEYEVETVFHLAAQALVGVAHANPLSTFETNIRGTWNLLEAGRRSRRIRRIVLASSDKAYGASAILPYTESLPLAGSHPYDVSKSCADLIGQAYARTYGLPVCVTRCANLFGGGDVNLSRLVPGTIVSLLRGERPVIRSNGKAVRDYLYVKDAVTAYLDLARAMDRPDVAGEAFNVSSENQIAVLDLVRTIGRLMGSDAEPLILDEARGEIPHQAMSSKKAREVLGWSPAYTLEMGLKETIAWYERHAAVS
jgi:CDP-glucose 4,6-dehydratase